MAQQVQVSFTLGYSTEAQRFVASGSSAQFTAGVAANGSVSASITGAASVFSRVLPAYNADYETGSGSGLEGFQFSEFPALKNSAGVVIDDYNGLPLDFTKITLICFRVRAIDPDQPWGGTVDITTTGDVVPGDKFGRTGIASDAVLMHYEAAGWEPGSGGAILVEYHPTTAPSASQVNAMVEMIIIGAPVPPVIPSFSSAPTISGTAQDGEILTVTSGGVAGTPTPLSGYQWVRCDASGNNPADIAGAKGSTYTAQAADVGNTIRVRQTITNTSGSDSATSAQTATVIPA